MMKKTLLASVAAVCLMAPTTFAQLDLGGAISGAINGATGGNQAGAAAGAQGGVQAQSSVPGANGNILPSGSLNSGAQVNASGSTNQTWLGRVRDDLRNALQADNNGTLQLQNNTSLQQYGFRPGDQLLGPNGQPLTQAQFDQYIQQNPGQVRVLRNGQTVVINGNAGYQSGQAYPGQPYQGHSHQQGQYYSGGQARQTASNERLRFGVTMNPAVQDGALVSGVVMGSPAAKAGLRPGDKIVAVNGQAVNNPGDMIQLVGNANTNDNVDVKFVRQGRDMQSQVVLASGTNVSGSGSYQAGYAQGFDNQSSGVVGAHGQFSGSADGNVQQRLDNLERMVQELRDEIRSQRSDNNSHQSDAPSESNTTDSSEKPEQDK